MLCSRCSTGKPPENLELDESDKIAVMDKATSKNEEDIGARIDRTVPSLISRLKVLIYAYIIMGVLAALLYSGCCATLFGGHFSLSWRLFLLAWSATMLGPFADIMIIGKFPSGTMGPITASLVCFVLAGPRLIWPSRGTAVAGVVGVLLWYFIGMLIVGCYMT